MSRSTVQFISQIKLEELRRQLAVLVIAYDNLRDECAGKQPPEALRLLHRGLSALSIGRKPLHPDLGDLDLLVQSGAASPEIAAFWCRRRESEREMGRLRADIVYLFGALLGEWTGFGAKRRVLPARVAEKRAKVYESDSQVDVRLHDIGCLLTDLVPLQLIHEQLLHDSSLDTA